MPDKFSGMVVFSDGPHRFWLQLNDDFESLDNLATNLVSHCATSSPHSVSHLRPGSLCAALYSVDETWYRASILEVTGNQAKV